MLNNEDRITLSLTVAQCNAALPYLAKGPFYRVAALIAAIDQGVRLASNGEATVQPIPATNGGASFNGEMPDHVPNRQ